MTCFFYHLARGNMALLVAVVGPRNHRFITYAPTEERHKQKFDRSFLKGSHKLNIKIRSLEEFGIMVIQVMAVVLT
jgi:hypothetical protein